MSLLGLTSTRRVAANGGVAHDPLSLILGFLPLIAFNVLAGRVANNGIAWGALSPWPLP